MAIIVDKKNVNYVCKICSKKIKNVRDIEVIIPISENKLDDSFMFSDEVIAHKDCCTSLTNYNLYKDLLHLRNKCIVNHRCEICDTTIDHPENFMMTLVLSSNPRDILYKFNFLPFHKSCFSNSDIRYRIEKEIEKRIEQGAWIHAFNNDKYMK